MRGALAIYGDRENLVWAKAWANAKHFGAIGSQTSYKGSIINVGVAKPKGRATPNIFVEEKKSRA